MIRKTAIWMLALLGVIGFAIFVSLQTHRRSRLEKPLSEVKSEPSSPASSRMSPKKHVGPQTVAALLGSFGEIAADPVADEKYPQAEWIAMLLERGIVIENDNDYLGYMVARRALAALENQPEMWASDIFGLPPTDDWETFKAAFISKKIWEYERFREAKQADPNVNGGLFTGPNGRIFLPTKPGRVYVKRQGTAALFFGESLDEIQEFNLLHKGIEPEGYEVIYIDEDGNRLAEAPPPLSREDIIEGLTLPPDGWVPPDGWTPPPWLEQALREKGWTGTFFPQDTAAQHAHPLETQRDFPLDGGHTSPRVSPDVRNKVERLTQTDSEQVTRAQLASEHNSWVSRELEAASEKPLTNISIEGDFENQVLSELLEPPTQEDIKATLSKRFHSARVARAMETLNRYGPEAGLSRLNEADAEIAAQIETLLDRKSTEQWQTIPMP